MGFLQVGKISWGLDFCVRDSSENRPRRLLLLKRAKVRQRTLQRMARPQAEVKTAYMHGLKSLRERPQIVFKKIQL